MLNGIDPIIIFQFSKLTPSAQEAVSKIPIVSSIVNKIGLPPIPIYLSEQTTGLYIDTEDKNIEIETVTDSLTDGAAPKTTQKALHSSVTINMQAKKGSIGLILLSAVCDLIIPKVTSQEYSISYLHEEVTIFGGLLHSLKVQAKAGTDLMDISIEIIKAYEDKKAGPPEVKPVNEAVSLNDGGIVSPTGGLTPPLAGPPPVVPSTPPPVTLQGLR